MPKISPSLVTSATRRRRDPLVVKGSQYSTNQTLDESFSTKRQHTSATRRRRDPLFVKGSQYSTNQTLDESFSTKKQHTITTTILTIYTILVGILAMPKISPPLVTSATRQRRDPLVVKGSQYSTNQTLDESFSASIEPRNSRHKSSKGTSSGNGERTR
jgi:hypothetical protein